jgi:hypothetical protein
MKSLSYQATPDESGLKRPGWGDPALFYSPER